MEDRDDGDMTEMMESKDNVPRGDEVEEAAVEEGEVDGPRFEFGSGVKASLLGRLQGYRQFLVSHASTISKLQHGIENTLSYLVPTKSQSSRAFAFIALAASKLWDLLNSLVLTEDVPTSSQHILQLVLSVLGKIDVVIELLSLQILGDDMRWKVVRSVPAPFY